MDYYTINFVAEGVGPYLPLATLNYYSQIKFPAAPSREQVAQAVERQVTAMHGERDPQHPRVLVKGDLQLDTEHGRRTLVSAGMLRRGCTIIAKVTGFPDPAQTTIEYMAQAVTGIQGARPRGPPPHLRRGRAQLHAGHRRGALGDGDDRRASPRRPGGRLGQAQRGERCDAQQHLRNIYASMASGSFKWDKTVPAVPSRPAVLAFPPADAPRQPAGRGTRHGPAAPPPPAQPEADAGHGAQQHPPQKPGTPRERGEWSLGDFLAAPREGTPCMDQGAPGAAVKGNANPERTPPDQAQDPGADKGAPCAATVEWGAEAVEGDAATVEGDGELVESLGVDKGAPAAVTVKGDAAGAASSEGDAEVASLGVDKGAPAAVTVEGDAGAIDALGGGEGPHAGEGEVDANGDVIAGQVQDELVPDYDRHLLAAERRTLAEGCRRVEDVEDRLRTRIALAQGDLRDDLWGARAAVMAQLRSRAGQAPGGGAGKGGGRGGPGGGRGGPGPAAGTGSVSLASELS